MRTSFLIICAIHICWTINLLFVPVIFLSSKNEKMNLFWPFLHRQLRPKMMMSCWESERISTKQDKETKPSFPDPLLNVAVPVVFPKLWTHIIRWLSDQLTDCCLPSALFFQAWCNFWGSLKQKRNGTFPSQLFYRPLKRESVACPDLRYCEFVRWKSLCDPKFWCKKIL